MFLNCAVFVMFFLLGYENMFKLRELYYIKKVQKAENSEEREGHSVQVLEGRTQLPTQLKIGSFYNECNFLYNIFENVLIVIHMYC